MQLISNIAISVYKNTQVLVKTDVVSDPAVRNRQEVKKINIQKMQSCQTPKASVINKAFLQKHLNIIWVSFKVQELNYNATHHHALYTLQCCNNVYIQRVVILMDYIVICAWYWTGLRTRIRSTITGIIVIIIYLFQHE